MANRTLSDLPVTTVIASADLIHTRQGTTDKSVTQGKNAEYAMNLSAYAPSVVSVTGTTHTISTTINKQLIICTISSNCTMTFPGTFGNNQEITILNVTGSTANVIGLPNSEVLYPGQEITFVWNGSAFIKKQFITNFITGTAAPTITPNYIGQIFVDGTNNVVYVSTGTATSADWLELEDKNLDISIKTADYTLLDTDTEDIYILNPNTVSQYGLLTLTANTTGANMTRTIRVEHGANQGLCRINANGAQRFDFNGNDLQYILLYMPGNYIEFFWNTNTSKWSIKDYNIEMHIGIKSRSDWTSVKIGSGVTYDNKSAGVDLTGMVITEATSSFTGIVVEDTGGTGASGILYVYNLSSSFTFWTNDRQLTASDGTTADVNEVSGSSKNIDYNLYHGFNINIKNYEPRFFYDATGDYTSMIYVGFYAEAGTTGISPIQIDVNSLQIATGGNGFQAIYAPGSVLVIDTEDAYEFSKIIF